jgi:hypothetical protein
MVSWGSLGVSDGILGVSWVYPGCILIEQVGEARLRRALGGVWESSAVCNGTTTPPDPARI